MADMPNALLWKLFPPALLVATLTLPGCWANAPATSRPPATALAAEPGIGDLRAAYAGPPDTWPAFEVDDGVDAVELGRVPPVPFPADNPHTDAKAALGEQLFFDPRLSRSNQMSCASCHDPDLGWADGRTVSFGTERLVLPRNAPTALGSGHFDKLFWDGRAESLEDLTLKVIGNADEMHGVGEAVAAKIAEVPEYVGAFEAVFGGGVSEAEVVTLERIAQAVATFVRTIEPGRSRFDRFVKRASEAGDTELFSDQELRGLHLYRTQGKCMNCHFGPMLSDGELHVTGLHLYGRRGEDLGAFGVTGLGEDRGAFRTPTLRHIARTGPYMHHGLFESLAVTVRSYNGGNAVGQPRGAAAEDPDYPVMSPLIHKLGLSEDDVQAMVAFLETLSEPHVRVEAPTLPPGLYGRE